MPHEIGHAELVRRRLVRDGAVDIPSSGISMFPLIRTGDMCRFVPIGGKVLKPGAVLLFADRDGRLIGHRLIRVEVGDAGPRYILKGDANLLPDEAVEPDRLLGVLETITRRTKDGRPRTANANNLPRKWWGFAVRHVPGLSHVLRRLAFVSSASSVLPARRL
jgi:signal peptidase